MNLTGINKPSYVEKVACKWCDAENDIAIGPQHHYGQADYHCRKCGKFGSFTLKGDAWFDQHNKKIQDEKEVWKRIPAEAYLSCRRGMQGAPFVYTVYLGKGDPKEYASRDSVEQVLINEFDMTWEQSNALLMSAALTPGQRIWMRTLTKISSALDDKEHRTGRETLIKRGTVVKVNGKEALFLRYAGEEGFAVVAFPGVGDTEVPTVDLQVMDTGQTPAEVGFGGDQDFQVRVGVEGIQCGHFGGGAHANNQQISSDDFHHWVTAFREA